MFAKLIILLGGAYLLVVNGILGVGFSRKTRRMAEIMGEKPARIFYAVIGILLIAYAIISYLNPHWMINTTV